MSDGETGGSPMVVPAGLLIGTVGAKRERPERAPWLAMLAAALLHALVLAAVLIDWSAPVSTPKPPEAISVTVVFAPPPEPPVAQPSPPPPKPAQSAYRESGPDQQTTAPPPAEAPAPEPASPPPAAPAQEPVKEPQQKPRETPQAQRPAAAPEPPKPKPQKEVARAEPQKKEAEIARAPHPAPQRHLNVEPGDKAQTGDPYLNRLVELVEQHRVFPRVTGPLGLLAEGAPIYELAIDRTGAVRGMRLAQSSGVRGLDEAGEGMILSAAPFPPPPADYPDGLIVTVRVRLFPPHS